MPKIEINTPASDFTLTDFTGQPFWLSKFYGKNIVLVFNRGFA